MASSTSSFPASRQCRYDVFLSFRGEDTRENFTSHLYAALCKKAIETFIDYELRRGDEISPALLEAIENSKAAVIIFSKNYASSPWCLDELVKIIQCHELNGQRVIPVFYHVDPSDVLEQTGVLEEAFAQHEINFLEKSLKWKAAMTKAANFAGWDSQVIRPESRLVDDIVKDILSKLKQTSSSGLEDLVGLDSRIDRVKALLSAGGLDVRILGIWGMGGIGKTTLARAVFNQLACGFEGCCFLENVREESERTGGLTRLREELLSKTLEERDLRMYPPSSVEAIFHRKKFLVVLDDVTNFMQLETLLGNRCRFGSGSRIIITSRDEQLLRQIVDDIYEAETLNYFEALELFSRNAFKQKLPPKKYEAWSNRFVTYADGNPLALKVLGSFLFQKGRCEWESASHKLEKTSNKNIQNILQISCEDLDMEEKEIFLHIACFFKGEDKENVMQLLDSCGFSTDIGVSVLIGKALITVIDNKLEMHDLLQEMGREIVRQESREPGKRSRLWNHEDIYQVLVKNTGTEAIEGIFLDMSEITEVHLNPNAFTRMPNLKFLKLYMPTCGVFEEKSHSKLQLSEGLKSLPNELRYLYWHGYPLKAFPVNFHPMNLVELILPYSNLKRLWKGSMDLVKLKKIDLSHSQHLMEYPCPSQAPNLTSINLTGCTSLPKKVPSSISQFSMLRSINLMGCKNIRSFPSTVDLKNLDTVVLAGCSKLERFPEFSRSIRHINLDRAAIKEVPLSVGSLDRLCELHVTNCTKLMSFPSSICKLKSLGIVNLSGCSNLKKFPEIFENMDDLRELVLDGTAIDELPSSIEHLKSLSTLHLNLCKNLAGLPESLCNLKALLELHLSGCSKLEKLPRNLKGLEHLWELKASRCDRLEIPADLNSLSSLCRLDLSCNKFERMPTSINQLTHLSFLDISQCEKLKSLPELPPLLDVINAFNCRSLDTISKLGELDIFTDSNLMFTNCFKLDQNARNDIVSLAEQKLKLFSFGADYYKELNLKAPYVRICYAGSEIPEWFPFQSIGSSITIQMPPYEQNGRFLGFASCIVVELHNSHSGSCFLGQFKAEFQTKNDSRSLPISNFYWSISIPVGETGELEKSRSIQSENLLLWYDGSLFYNDDRCTEFGFEKQWYDEATFVFSATPHCGDCKVKKCGVLLLFSDKERITSTTDEDEEEKQEASKSETCQDDCKGEEELGRSDSSKEKEEESKP